MKHAIGLILTATILLAASHFIAMWVGCSSQSIVNGILLTGILNLGCNLRKHHEQS